METSIYFAKIIWPLLIVIALSLILNFNNYKLMIKKMWDNPLILFLSGLSAYVMGILIVLNHNVWALNWFVIITIIWWVWLIKWISIILFPNFAPVFINKLKITKSLMSFIWILYLILGLCVTYVWYSPIFLG